MLSDRLVLLLEKEADRLTRNWVVMLKSDENTPSYHEMEDQSLVTRINEVYQKLNLWLDWEISSRDLAKFFIMVGQERRREQVPISEVVYAIALARRNLNEHIMEEGRPGNALELQRLIEFNNRVIRFFDKAVFFTMKGYEGFAEESKEEDGVLEHILQAFTAGTPLEDKTV